MSEHRPSDTSEAIISTALGRGPDISLGSASDGWQLCRWRQFVGSYVVPALPEPLYAVHIAGKQHNRTWLEDDWSETVSIPGCATIVPAGMQTGWLINGELDVVTLSVSSDRFQRAAAVDQFKALHFAFADPLGVALIRQILNELYAPRTGERDAYVGTLVDALKAHMLNGPVATAATPFPVSSFSSYRLHAIINDIQQRPEAEHGLEEMAARAGVTPTHFCRIFRKATGVTPHQFVMKARLDRAQTMLERSEASMATIAESLGFTSQSHFTRAFRQFAGATPSDYRRRGKGTLQ